MRSETSFLSCKYAEIARIDSPVCLFSCDWAIQNRIRRWVHFFRRELYCDPPKLIKRAMNERRSFIALLKRAPAVAFIFRLETMFVEKILLCLFGGLCRIDKEPFYSRRMITMRSNVVLVERVQQLVRSHVINIFRLHRDVSRSSTE